MGVTCADVIEGLEGHLHQMVQKEEFDDLPERMQTRFSQAYRANRSTARAAPGGALGTTMLRLDWLGDELGFGGLVVNEAYSMQIYGRMMPNLFEWKRTQNYDLPRVAEKRVQKETDIVSHGEDERQPPKSMDSGSGESVYSAASQEEDGR